MEPPCEIEHFKDPQKNGRNLKNQQAKTVRTGNKEKKAQLDTIVDQHTESIIVDQLQNYCDFRQDVFQKISQNIKRNSWTQQWTNTQKYYCRSVK